MVKLIILWMNMEKIYWQNKNYMIKIKFFLFERLINFIREMANLFKRFNIFIRESHNASLIYKPGFVRQNYCLTLNGVIDHQHF